MIFFEKLNNKKILDQKEGNGLMLRRRYVKKKQNEKYKETN